MDLEYRKALQEDYEELASLFNKIFGKRVSPLFFEWKYRKGYSVVALSEGKIVGHYGGIFFDFLYNNKIYKVVQATDLMTHPEVRHLSGRKSVLYNMADLFFQYCFKKGIDFAYGFPGERSRLFGERFLNYVPLSRVKFLCFSTEGGEGFIPVEKIQFLNYDLKNILLSNRREGILKDVDYFQWRFIENPIEEYFLCENRGALFVFKILNKEAIIMDFFFKNKKDLRIIFFACKNSLKNLGVEVIKTFPSFFIEDNTIKKIEENYYLEFKPLLLNPGNFLDLKYFSPSDYDAL